MTAANVPGAVESGGADYRVEAESRHRRGLTALRWIIAFTVLSTVLHYSHNAIAIQRYPQPVDLDVWTSRAIVIVGWFVFSAAGVLGYRAYRARRYWAAQGWLAVYALIGIITMGHFLVGVPDVPGFWFATLFTDLFGGLAIWAFVIWSAVMLGEGSRALRPAR